MIMTEELVKTVTSRNLTTWFLLPLIHLNQDSFGMGNFVESYVNSSGLLLTIELRSLMYLTDPKLRKHDQFIKESELRSKAWMWFRLPEEWQTDFERFKSGKYSRFSSEAKHLIRNYGGDDDIRLMALDRDPYLRRWWERELGLRPLPEDLDLLPIPSESNYRER